VTKDPDLAADVVQEAWIKIIKALPRLKDPVSFQAWAYRIVNNQCMDVLRKRSTQYRETNVPKGMVKSRLFNARDKFRILLTGNKEGETHEPARQTNRSANSGSLANSI
jgi:RNA polymerase sigma factor (sigma-70 family)